MKRFFKIPLNKKKRKWYACWVGGICRPGFGVELEIRQYPEPEDPYWEWTCQIRIIMPHLSLNIISCDKTEKQARRLVRQQLLHTEQNLRMRIAGLLDA